MESPGGNICLAASLVDPQKATKHFCLREGKMADEDLHHDPHGCGCVNNVNFVSMLMWDGMALKDGWGWNVETKCGM